MLQISNVDKRYAGEQILSGVSLTVTRGDRVGVVGANGSGKSTLLRIIAGLEPPDAGSVSLAPGTRLGLLRQGFWDDGDQRAATALQSDAAVWAAYARLEHQTAALAVAPADPAALRDYAAAATDFEEAGGYERLAAVEGVLRGLGLSGLDPGRRVATLSGGQKTRLALAGLLLGARDALLLDEPTNHLDVEALRWLEDFVTGYRGAVLLVSHDRAFLDATVTTILEIDDRTHTPRSWPGNYSAYAEAKQRETERRSAAYRDQQAEIARVEQDIHLLREQARGVEAKTQSDYRGATRGAKGTARVRAAKVARKATVREHKLEKELDEHRLEKPGASWTLKLAFAPVPGGAREVLRVDGVHKAFGERVVLDGVDMTLRHGERVVLTGPNGGGKSTLLRIVTGADAADAGVVRLSPSAVVGYYDQEHEGLDPRRTPLDVVRGAAAVSETEARTLLHAYLFGGAAAFTPIRNLSYGERARLVLARLVLSGANLLLLDEPTNHLDIPSREQFEAALASFDGTILAVLHDRYAIERLATRVVELRDGRLYDLDPRTVGAADRT